MTKLIRTAALVLMISLLGATAAAQDARWTHPGGLYALDMSGWTFLESTDQELAVFELTGERQAVRMCFVRERRMQLPHPLTQAELNARLPSFTPQIDGVQITEREDMMVDGVAIAAFRMESANGPGVINHYRIFALADAQGALYQELSCGGVPPISAEQEAVFRATLNSLRINATGSAQ